MSNTECFMWGFAFGILAVILIILGSRFSNFVFSKMQKIKNEKMAKIYKKEQVVEDIYWEAKHIKMLASKINEDHNSIKECLDYITKAIRSEELKQAAKKK